MSLKTPFWIILVVAALFSGTRTYHIGTCASNRERYDIVILTLPFAHEFVLVRNLDGYRNDEEYIGTRIYLAKTKPDFPEIYNKDECRIIYDNYKGPRGRNY